MLKMEVLNPEIRINPEVSHPFQNGGKKGPLSEGKKTFDKVASLNTGSKMIVTSGVLCLSQ